MRAPVIGMAALALAGLPASDLVAACGKSLDEHMSIAQLSPRSPSAANRPASPVLESSDCWLRLGDSSLDLDEALLVDVRSPSERRLGLVDAALHARVDDSRIAALFPQRTVLLFGTGKNDHVLVAHCQAQRQAGASNVFVLSGGVRALASVDGRVHQIASSSEKLVTLSAGELKGIGGMQPRVYVAGSGAEEGDRRRWAEALGVDVETWRRGVNDEGVRGSGLSAVVLLPPDVDLKTWRVRHGLQDRRDVLYYTEGIDAFEASERRDRLIAENAYRPLPSGCGN